MFVQLWHIDHIPSSGIFFVKLFFPRRSTAPYYLYIAALGYVILYLPAQLRKTRGEHTARYVVFHINYLHFV